MNAKVEPVKYEQISCDICMSEVPSNEAKLSEVDDYVIYFCGLECYDKWHKQSEKKSDNL